MEAGAYPDLHSCAVQNNGDANSLASSILPSKVLYESQSQLTLFSILP